MKEVKNNCPECGCKFPGSFMEFWDSRNSFKTPYNHPERSEEDRAFFAWIHGVSRGMAIKEDALEAKIRAQIEGKNEG